MSNSSHTYDVDKALTTNAYSKTGYDFSGWATTSTGTKVYDNNEVVKNLTTEGTYELFAIWTASQYTVSFNTNGGSAVNNITVTYDSDYGDLPETTKNGYTFAGWFLESGFATEVTDTTIVKTASNHTLYAKWTINPYTITLDYNGGTDNFLLTSSGQLTLSGTAEFSETYHGVSGVEDTTEAKFNGSKSIKVSDLGCFVGSDVAGKYKLSAYLMYNGTGSIQVEGYAEDVTTYDMVGSDTVTLPSGIWVYMSFEYTLTDGSAGNWCNIIFENITDSSSYYIDDIKVRRIDTYNPKTTYNYNIESGAMELPYAVKDGYTFIGWSTDKNATTGIMTHVAGQTGNVTYYAIYKLSNPTATTSADNATIIYNGTDNATLTATVNTEGVAMDSIAYQWYRDGVAIDGATSATYTHTSNALDVGTYTYYCKVTTTKGTETSSEIQSTSTTITVQQATTTIDITMSDYVYAGEISTPTGTTNSDCGDSAITFYCNTTGVASGGTKWTNMTSTSLNVGTYYIYATTPATTNYKAGVSDVVEFKVTEATIELDYMADSNAGLTEDGYNIEYSSGLDEDGLTVKIGPANTDATIAYWIGTGEKTTETVSKGNMLTLPTLNNADTIIYNYTVTAPNYTTITGTITLKITKGTTAVVWEIEDAYTYDGTDQSASVKAHIVGVDGNDIDCNISFTINDESVEFKNAGTYTVTATLTGNEASNYNLTNDTQSITIDRLAIVITAANKSMTYGGTAPEYTCSASVVAPDSYTVSYTLYKETINGGSTELTEITGDLSTLDVGTYKITPSSNLSTTNYNVTYENGTLTISPKQLAKPYVIGTYTYNRTAQTVQLDNFDTNTMEIVSGNTGTDADAYTVVIKLKDSANYTWNDGTIANVELNWTIAKYDLSGATIATIPQQPFTGSAVEPKPQVTALGATLVDGTDFTYDYENNINAGTQAVVIINAVENSNYTGTNSANFTIAGAFIEIPTVSGTYIYNGAEQTVVLNGFDSSTMEIVSGNKGTNADTYTVEIALTNSVNYTWATGSKENITLDWTIAKADVTLGLESDNILVRVGDSATNKATITLDYSGNLDGQSLTTTGGSANANITTSAISNNVSTITITPTKSMTGTETITVIYDGDTNHNEASATFTLEIPAIKVEIVVSGSGSGTLSNTIEGSTDEVELNSDITFTATPSTNYGLAKYTVGTENTTYITSSTDLTAVFSKEINVTDNLLTDSDSDGIKDKLTINLYFEEVITLDITNEGDAGSISNDFITKYENNEVAHIYADNKLTTFKNSTIGLDVEAKKVGDQYYVVNEITVDGESTTINLLNTTTSIDSDASSVSIKSAKVYNADNRQITDGTKNIATVSVEVKQNYNAVTIEDSKYVVENSAVNFVITETNSDYDFLGIRRSIVNESGEIEYVNVLRDQLNSSEWNISTNTDNQTVRTWTEQSFTESLSEAEPLMLERWYEVNNTKNRTVEVTIDSGVSAKLVNTDIGYSYTLATDIFNEGTDALYAGGWMVVIDSTTTNISNYDVSIQVYTSGSDTPTEYGKDAQFTIDSNVTKVVISITNLSTSTSTTIE
ncbi:MAG: InlB B-repeat-containing protein [Clostridia bacterium]|nr:InlB B-repeat-containing protein [Clostridia bacterium]